MRNVFLYVSWSLLLYSIGSIAFAEGIPQNSGELRQRAISKYFEAHCGDLVKYYQECYGVDEEECSQALSSLASSCAQGSDGILYSSETEKQIFHSCVSKNFDNALSQKGHPVKDKCKE